MKVKIINKVALAVFIKKKLLMVRPNTNEKVFLCLGGTVESGESDAECLVREIEEEISCKMDVESLEFLAEFEDWAHGRENTKVNIKLYKGNLIGNPKPLSEIVEIDYFDSKTDKKYLSAIALNQMFPWLKQNGYIN
jgi:8-oxo-dGTP diphosphatase